MAKKQSLSSSLFLSSPASIKSSNGIRPFSFVYPPKLSTYILNFPSLTLFLPTSLA